MNIAILAPIHWRTPPRTYGPWELIASRIAEGMVQRGHIVTLYATGDSITTARLKSVCPSPLMESPNLESKVYQYLHTASVFENAHDYDLIHNHYDAYPLTFSRLITTPVVTTIHGFSSPQVHRIYEAYSNTRFVSISYADRQHAPDLPYVANIYHGIPVHEYPFNNNPEDYVCFVGRISPDKGVHLAIALAKKLKIQLKIAGLVPSENALYFEREIKPHLNADIQYLGLIDEEEKKSLLKNAYCFLHLNQYPEGFGITLIEAMACGTPVIGMDLGSIREVVAEQQTGFVVTSLEEAEQALRSIRHLSREQCRKLVEERFTLDMMLQQYEGVYQTVISEQKKVNASVLN